MTPKARLLTEQRRRNVLDLVDQDGQVTVADLVKRFSISAVTVRSDLDALASLGAVVRSHGGAVRRLEATQDYPLGTKETLQGRKDSDWKSSRRIGATRGDHHSRFRYDHSGS